MDHISQSSFSNNIYRLTCCICDFQDAFICVLVFLTNFNILLRNNIFSSSSLYSSAFLSVQALVPYSMTRHTRYFSSLIFNLNGIQQSFNTLFSCIILVFAMQILTFISLVQKPSSDLFFLKYFKFSMLSNGILLKETEFLFFCDVQ